MAKKKQFATAAEAPQIQAAKTLTKRHAFGIATMMMIAMMTFFAALVLIGYSVLSYRYVKSGPLSEDTVFEVPSGAGLSTIARSLEDDGIIASDTVFKLFVKFDKGVEHSVQPEQNTQPNNQSSRRTQLDRSQCKPLQGLMLVGKEKPPDPERDNHHDDTVKSGVALNI